MGRKSWDKTFRGWKCLNCFNNVCVKFVLSQLYLEELHVWLQSTHYRTPEFIDTTCLWTSCMNNVRRSSRGAPGVSVLLRPVRLWLDYCGWKWSAQNICTLRSLFVHYFSTVQKHEWLILAHYHYHCPEDKIYHLSWFKIAKVQGKLSTLNGISRDHVYHVYSGVGKEFDFFQMKVVDAVPLWGTESSVYDYCSFHSDIGEVCI